MIEKISEYTNNEINSEIIQLDIPQLLNIQFQKNWVENDVEFKNMFSAEVRKQEDEVFALSEITLEESSKKLEELLKKINGGK
ncbi:hypothetical protein NW062_06540 [Mycoplasmopsis cynos]|nr:hypothetical protein NW062_06540 [Mycoplasmopsis cynos]